MSTTVIRRGNRQVGTMTDTGNQIVIRDMSMNVQGWYDKNTDSTRNRHGQHLAHGNQVGMLIR